MSSLLDFGSLPHQVQHIQVLSLANSVNIIIVAVEPDESHVLVRGLLPLKAVCHWNREQHMYLHPKDGVEAHKTLTNSRAGCNHYWLHLQYPAVAVASWNAGLHHQCSGCSVNPSTVLIHTGQLCMLRSLHYSVLDIGIVKGNQNAEVTNYQL